MLFIRLLFQNANRGNLYKVMESTSTVSMPALSLVCGTLTSMC